MPSRSLRDSISMGVGDAVDYVKGSISRDRARQAARKESPPSSPSRPAVRGQSGASGLSELAPRTIVNRKRNIDKAIDDAS